MTPLQPQDPTRTEYTGDNFKNIILLNGNDVIAKEFFDAEFSNEGGNGRARRIEDEQKGIFLPVSILPRFYQRREWLENYHYTLNGVFRRALPTFTIASEVNVENVELKRHISVSNCHFLQPVNFVNITGEVSISFYNCTFDKPIRFQDATIKKLSITNSKGFVTIAVTDCKLSELEIKGNREVKLYVDNTKADLMNLDLGLTQ